MGSAAVLQNPQLVVFLGTIVQLVGLAGDDAMANLSQIIAEIPVIGTGDGQSLAVLLGIHGHKEVDIVRFYHLFPRRTADADCKRIQNSSKGFYEYDEGVFVQPRGFDGLAYMMIQTTVGVPMDATMLNNYFRALINLFFKILPIKESGESSLEVYMRSLQAELLGCKELIEAIHDDPLLLSLIAILQYLIDTPECEVSVVKREVFRAISICNKLKARYAVQQEVS